MHELRRRHIHDCDRSRELHKLRYGQLLHINRCFDIIDVHKLFGRHLRGDHGIDGVRSLQHW